MGPVSTEVRHSGFYDHPGFEMGECPLRITIVARLYSTSSNGYACSDTGGHCLPDGYCQKRRERAALKDHPNE